MTEPMELAYEERGSGPVLLFVHGFPFDRTMWIAQLAGLAKLRTCVAVDLRGHGLSTDPSPGDYSMDLFADDVARTLDAIGADQADVCALSMGGYVAFALLRRHRARVRSLILVDTKAEADGEEARAARDKTAQLVLEHGMEALWDGLGEKLLAPGASDEAREKARRIALGLAPEVAAADALAMRDRPDSTADLSGIDVPVLWLHGEQDQLMPAAAARASAERIPGARFVEIPDAGHLAPIEQPQAVNDAIAAFLRGI